MKQLLWFKYTVSEPLQWIGHLSLMRAFERAWRRSGLPVAYSEGYNPRIKQAFALPLAVGCTSECESGELELSDWVKVSEVKERVIPFLVPGLELQRVVIAPTLQHSLMSLAKSAVYRVEVEPANDLDQIVAQFMSKKEVMMHKKTKHQEKEINIRPMVKQLAMENGMLVCQLQVGSEGNLKPTELIRNLEGALDIISMHRTSILDAKGIAILK